MHIELIYTADENKRQKRKLAQLCLYIIGVDIQISGFIHNIGFILTRITDVNHFKIALTNSHDNYSRRPFLLFRFY